MSNTNKLNKVAMKLIEFFETDKMRGLYMIIGNIFLFVNLILGGIAFFYGFMIACLKGSIFDIITLSNLGQFYSGTVITFLTLATICLISLAYVNQRIEIKHLKDLNEIQTKEIEDSKQTQKFERFEKTFFKMIDLYHLIVSSMRLKGRILSSHKFSKNRSVNCIGREVFKELYGQLVIHFKKHNSKVHDNQKIINLGFTDFDVLFEDHIGNYYRQIYLILKTIDENIKLNVITIDQSRYYIEVIRAQFSDYELILLFYDGLSKYGGEGFKELLTNFSFFRYLDTSKVYNYLDLNLYFKEAYEKL